MVRYSHSFAGSTDILALAYSVNALEGHLLVLDLDFYSLRLVRRWYEQMRPNLRIYCLDSSIPKTINLGNPSPQRRLVLRALEAL